MVYKQFRTKIVIRTILIVLSVFCLVYIFLTQNSWYVLGVLATVLIFQIVELIHFLEITNRKLTRFLESIRYSDFVSTFTTDSRLGGSFKDLNFAFNEVLDAFRNTRSEKESHLHYLNTIVEHVGTGLLAFDQDGYVELINVTTKKLLGIIALNNIEDLIDTNSRLYKTFFDLAPGKSTTYTNHEDKQLSIHATQLILKGRKVKLLSIQNIQSELQKKELEAWQNLARVLRHEIMNSITPIASLTATLRTILLEDLLMVNNENYSLNAESADDLREGLGTIENRSKGLIRFIDAYRDYTSISLPTLAQVELSDLFTRIKILLNNDLRKKGVELQSGINPESLSIQADEKLVEQVLINLVKNAIEATFPGDVIYFYAIMKQDGRVQIMIEDHGEGIVREALERIFVPFYTTKHHGSGIGLSLSRQIMQLHQGSLTAQSEPGEFTRFTLNF